MDAATPDAAPAAGASLSQCEVETAIRRLTDGEKTALMKIAMLYARKTPYEAVNLSESPAAV
jgi:hypothetical protein